MADIVLPTTSPFESEGLKVGFETSEAACSLIQMRKRLVEPRGEARSDIQIVFDLACRLGYGKIFWDGDSMGSPPLHSSSSPSSRLQCTTTSSPTLNRFTRAPI